MWISWIGKQNAGECAAKIFPKAPGFPGCVESVRMSLLRHLKNNLFNILLFGSAKRFWENVSLARPLRKSSKVITRVFCLFAEANRKENSTLPAHCISKLCYSAGDPIQRITHWIFVSARKSQINPLRQHFF